MSHDITVRLFRLPHLCVFEIYGELLSDTEMAKGAAVKGIGRAGANAVAADDRVTEIKTLSDMGITKDQSSKWKKLAAVPGEEFIAAEAAALRSLYPGQKCRK